MSYRFINVSEQKLNLLNKNFKLTPKGRSLFFGPFLKFVQAIVDVKSLVNMWFSISFKTL
jgi:hypothetical protein